MTNAASIQWKSHLVVARTAASVRATGKLIEQSSRVLRDAQQSLSMPRYKAVWTGRETRAESTPAPPSPAVNITFL
jgi:hypothetical protein